MDGFVTLLRPCRIESMVVCNQDLVDNEVYAMDSGMG